MTSPKIAVLVSTLDRSHGLKVLLDAIGRLRLDPWPDAAVVVIVVDNSDMANASSICDQAAEGRFELIYVHEPRRGLSFARNAALETALDAEATHVAFIDDDELPDPNWLIALHSTLERTQATAVIGPVRPIFEGLPPVWCVESAVFAKTHVPSEAFLPDGYTSNAIVDLGFIARRGLRFALRYNSTGGEDTMFFRCLRAGGGTIAWSSDALVYETIPVARTSPRWLIRRWFRTGGTEGDLAGHTRSGTPRHLHNLTRGCARILGGFGILVVGIARHPAKPGTALAGPQNDVPWCRPRLVGHGTDLCRIRRGRYIAGAAMIEAMAACLVGARMRRKVLWSAIALVAGVSLSGAQSGTPPSSGASTTLDLSAFTPTFSDDFRTFTSSPDGSRGWRTTLDWGNRTLPANHELQYYSDTSVGLDPFRLHDGVLDIRAAAASNPLHLPYDSGAITTLGRFAQTFGYFEIRAKLPKGEGFWPAFWLLPADHSWPPELDVFEQYGKDPHDIVVTTHSGSSGQHSFTYKNVSTEDVTAGFHTYGVDWEADETRWYVDRQLVFSAPTPDDMRKPMYLVANLAVSSMPTSPYEIGIFSIDYIRAYQRKAEASSKLANPASP